MKTLIIIPRTQRWTYSGVPVEINREVGDSSEIKGRIGLRA
jgi:hypothetical protein